MPTKKNSKAKGPPGLAPDQLKKWALGGIAREKVKKGLGLTPEEVEALLFREKGRAVASRKNGGAGGRPAQDFGPLAKSFLEKSGTRVLYQDGFFYVFDRTHPEQGYRKTTFAEMETAVGRWLVQGGGAESGWAEKNVTIAIRALTLTDRKPPCRLDTGEALGPVAFMQNGLLDLDKAADGKADALTPYKTDAENFFTMEAYPFPWKPDCPGTYWRKFLDTAFPDEATRKDVGRMLAVGIGNRMFTAFWHFVGEQGSGRSTLLTVLDRMFGGPPRTTALPPDQFKDKHRMGELCGGTVANIVSDGACFGGPRERETLKTITGGGGVRVANRPLYVNATQAAVTVRLNVFASNDESECAAFDDATLARYILIPMNQQFRRAEGEIKDLYKRIAPEPNDPTYPGELPRVFADAVAAWKEIRDLPNVPKCAEGEARVAAMRTACKPVEVFLADVHARVKMGERTLKAPFFSAFKAWLAEKGISWMEWEKDEKKQQAKFTADVQGRFKPVQTVKVRIGKKTPSAFANLTWTPPPATDEPTSEVEDEDAPPPDEAAPLAGVAEERPDDFEGVAADAVPAGEAPDDEGAPAPSADVWRPAYA